MSIHKGSGGYALELPSSLPNYHISLVSRELIDGRMPINQRVVLATHHFPAWGVLETEDPLVILEFRFTRGVYAVRT